MPDQGAFDFLSSCAKGGRSLPRCTENTFYKWETLDFYNFCGQSLHRRRLLLHLFWFIALSFLCFWTEGLWTLCFCLFILFFLLSRRCCTNRDTVHGSQLHLFGGGSVWKRSQSQCFVNFVLLRDWLSTEFRTEAALTRRFLSFLYTKCDLCQNTIVRRLQKKAAKTVFPKLDKWTRPSQLNTSDWKLEVGDNLEISRFSQILIFLHYLSIYIYFSEATKTVGVLSWLSWHKRPLILLWKGIVQCFELAKPLEWYLLSCALSAGFISTHIFVEILRKC